MKADSGERPEKADFYLVWGSLGAVSVVLSNRNAGSIYDSVNIIVGFAVLPPHPVGTLKHLLEDLPAPVHLLEEHHRVW